MHYFFLSFVLVVVSQQIFITDADLCKVSLASIPSPEPVYLIPIVGSKATTYEPLKPTGKFTLLSEGTEIRTFCPGSGNVLQSLRENSLDLVCGARDNWQTSSGAIYKLQDLPCESIPTSDLKLTSEKCGGAHRRGYIYEAGFRTDDRNFATTFKICYDNVTETTLYTQNTINGAAIGYSVTEDTRRAFRANGMRFTTKAANNFYTIKNQIERFESYFGKQQNYVHPRLFLARGHLSPDADFIFGYEQLATYFYANVAPEFQSVNAGNWLRVENLARKLAADFSDDLETYNGYMGLLKLPHPKTHKPVAIFLDKEQHMPVPEYFFKVIMHEVSNAAIVMISLNNPFATNPKEKEFCTNVCHKADLYSKHFEDASRGYTFCCELNDFRRFYEDLPNHLSANCLLHKNGNNICGKDTKKIIDAKEDSFPYTVEEEETDPETLYEKNGCSITMPDDIASPEPVYILTTSDNPKPRLLRPTGPITSIPIDSSLTLVCAGVGNTLANFNEQSLELTCQEDGAFYSSSLKQNIQLLEMNCARIPTPDILLTSKRCAAGKGYIFHPGYFLGAEFVDAFDICYNNRTQQNLYSIDIINGATQNFKINKISRRTFRADGLQATTSATNIIYTLNNQVERFEKYFGSDQQHINKSMFLARGHLAPDADFIFGYEQVATYYYANVAPQFQIVNSANWIRVENIARNLATLYSSDLLVITGTYGLLQLPVGKRKKVVDIYLDDAETVPVPKWFYKILLHPKLNADIVMITLNNPYAQSKDIEEFCPNVCEKYGLDSAHFKDLSRGYTFCCNFKDFNAALIEIPVFDLPDGWKFKAM